jgi:hypothetical protein
VRRAAQWKGESKTNGRLPSAAVAVAIAVEHAAPNGRGFVTFFRPPDVLCNAATLPETDAGVVWPVRIAPLGGPNPRSSQRCAAAFPISGALREWFAAANSSRPIPPPRSRHEAKGSSESATFRHGMLSCHDRPSHQTEICRFE